MFDRNKPLWHRTFFLVLFSQLIIFSLYPFMDTTEARYAEIARIMLEKNDWITPWFNQQLPFWGKPPLSFWLTLFGFKIFGINEFAGRLFYWISSLLPLFTVQHIAQRLKIRSRLLAPAVLLSMLLFYIASSAVMTDMPLLLGGCISLLAIIRIIQQDTAIKINALLLALGVSIGMLAKGPISLILFLGPLFIWAILESKLLTIFKFIHIRLLIILITILSIPWYIIAELKTPGFLEYFFIGEHWNRYLIAGWEGDLYGNAHDYARGSIWIFFLIATLPWGFVLAFISLSKLSKKIINQNTSIRPTIQQFLLIWILLPLIFFTFSGNVLWTYTLPCLPALSLLISHYLENQLSKNHLNNLLQFSLISVVAIKICLIGYLYISSNMQNKSSKNLIHQLRINHISLEQVYFYPRLPFSASFYSEGKTRLWSFSDLEKKTITKFYLVTKQLKLDEPLANRSHPIPIKSGKYQVMVCSLN
jgi:4-amino-4-deoxy-L-arabinose transferase-like glycosyltransferase